MLKTPSYWYQTRADTPIAIKLLAPLGYLYPLVGKIRTLLTKPYKSSIPVICIGNLTAGGSGKTPAALALLALIKDLKPDSHPCFLTRGYGGSSKGPMLVDQQSTFDLVGDEALLLSKHAPTIIAANRPDGACLAEENGYDLIIMDDGYQTPSLHKDINILVVDGPLAFGNQNYIPFGPMRENIGSGVKKADAIIAVRGRPEGLDHSRVIDAQINPQASLPAGARVIAFCGLGKPEKFRTTLTQQDITLLSFHNFPDHHPYTADDIEKLKKAAQQQKALLVTTEKDACRIADLTDINILYIAMTFKQPDHLIELLKAHL